MRVLIATSTFPLEGHDGLPRFVFDLARALQAHCRVTVLAPHHPGARLRASMDGLDIRRFRYAWPPGLQRLAYGSGMTENLNHSWLARLAVPAYFASLSLAMRRLVRRQRFDVVNSHWLIPQGLSAAWVLGGHRTCAHVVTVHAGDVMMLARLPGGRTISRAIARHTDLFLPAGDHVGRRLQEMAGGDIAWVSEPMGVDFHRFADPGTASPADMPFHGNFILFVGRLVAIKGVDVLLESMPALLEKDNDLGLVVIGTGSEARRLKRKTDQSGLSHRVVFTGRLDHERIPAYLHACRVAVLPSIVGPGKVTEGTPTVLAEAMAAGCRVVASRTGGAEAVIRHGINGWLARPGDPRDLARKLSLALAHRGGGICRMARETARRMDWPRVARRYLGHFENAIRLRRLGKR